jgi:hypothetical protein
VTYTAHATSVYGRSSGAAPSLPAPVLRPWRGPARRTRAVPAWPAPRSTRLNDTDVAAAGSRCGAMAADCLPVPPSSQPARAEHSAAQPESSGCQKRDLRAGGLDDHTAEGAADGHAHGDDRERPGERLGSASGRDSALDRSAERSQPGR